MVLISVVESSSALSSMSSEAEMATAVVVLGRLVVVVVLVLVARAGVRVVETECMWVVVDVVFVDEDVGSWYVWEASASILLS